MSGRAVAARWGRAVNVHGTSANRIRLRAWLGALVLVLAQAATAVHAAENEHGITGPVDDLCVVCLHGDRHDGALPPAVASPCGAAPSTAVLFSIPQDRHPVQPLSRSNGARAPPRHSSTA